MTGILKVRRLYSISATLVGKLRRQAKKWESKYGKSLGVGSVYQLKCVGLTRPDSKRGGFVGDSFDKHTVSILALI